MIKDFLKVEEDKIPKLAFHTLTLCGNIITIFGGMSGKNTYNGDIFFIKIGGRSIINASYEKNKTMFPKPRHSHTANYDEKTKRMYIFGGYAKEEPHYLNQLCVMELKSFPTIIFQSVKAINITSRCRHASFYIDGKLYIYGGVGLDKVTKTIKVLNDFYYLDVESGKIVEVTSKGGNEMAGKLFKIVKIDSINSLQNSISSDDRPKLDFAFFTSNLSKFFVFNLENETFTKIEVKFNVPFKRDFFSIDKLKDGRIVLFGGSEGDESYKDVYYLVNYTYDQRVYWLWNRMDILGTVDYGYSGHTTLVLDNNHILIHGGTVRAFDCLNPEYVKHEPIFSNRLQLFNIYISFEWLKMKEGEDEFYAHNINNPFTTNTLNITDNGQAEANEKNVLNSIMNITAYIPKEAEDFAKILIHGGEREDQTLCKFFIYNLNENQWMPPRKEDEYTMSPQLKGHAWAPYWLYSSKAKDYFVIISGGITIDHSGHSCKVSNPESQKRKVNNTQRQNCSCRNETISNNLYAYQHNSFAKIHLSKDNNVNAETLRRYGHSMVYMPDRDCLFMLCGFIQYQGYVMDIVQLEIKRDEELYKKSRSSKETDFGLVCKLKEVDLKEWGISGRMHASVSLVYNQIVIFGGIRDDVPLNDMYIINFKENLSRISVTTITNDPKVIFPRFGMSTVVHIDDIKEDISRIIIFGGSIYSGKKMTQGIRNETLIFQVRSNNINNDLKVESYIPCIYGFSEKRVFHSAVLHEDDMYVFGGLNTKFQILSIPTFISYDVDTTINPPMTYQDWEKGNTSIKKQRNTFAFGSPRKTAQKGERIANITTIGSKVEVEDEIEDNDFDNKSDKSGEKLIEKKDKSSVGKKSIDEKEKEISLLNESNPLIENNSKMNTTNNPLIEEKEIEMHSKKKSKGSDTASNSVLSSQANSKKGFVIKKKMNKNKNWDDQYDW